MATPKKPCKAVIRRRWACVSEQYESAAVQKLRHIANLFLKDKDQHRQLVNRIMYAVKMYQVGMELRTPSPAEQKECLRLLIESLRESESRLANIPLFAIHFGQQKFVPLGQRHRLGRPKLEEEIAEIRARLEYLAEYLDVFLNTFDLNIWRAPIRASRSVMSWLMSW